MKVLAVADRVSELVYGPGIRKYFGDVRLVLSCGDLPYEYLDYIVTMLNVPLFFVHGNHDREWVQTAAGVEPARPDGCIDLNRRVLEHEGLLLAGLEGSQRYRPGPFQYSDSETAWRARLLWPGLMRNRLRTGRYLDILVTHAPPRGIHDLPDLCHRGFGSYLHLMDRYKPRYLVHGHVHLYGRDQHWRSTYHQTEVVNAYGYRVLEVDVPGGRKAR